MFSVSKKFSSLCFLLLISISHAEVINYRIYYNSVPPEQHVVQDNIKIITQTLNMLDSKAVGNNSFSFQDGIEYLLLYGALLRNEITNNYGRLIYNHYQALSVSEIEALQKINLQILERKYNIFNLLPEIFKSGDLSPASICRYMQPHISICLKKYSIICMNIAAGNNDFHQNISNTTSFFISQKIYQSMRGSRSNSNRFSATVVMKYLKIDEIKVTSGLFLGLLLNVQYDNLDHNILTAERHVSQDLYLQSTTEMKKSPRRSFKKFESMNLLVKNNLLNYVSEAAQSYGSYLSQHIYTKPTEVDEKIELLAFIYGNQSINLKSLFELILPNDTLDADVIDARDYLRIQIEEQNILKDFLKVNKYQQTSPDQLLLNILMQIQELGFMTDLASALYTHALFWHQSHSVENLGQLLELFNAFNNLHRIPAYNKFMETIYQIKDHLKDSLNTDIDIRCARPRVCLKMGLKILAYCNSIDNTTVELIQRFLYDYNHACDANLQIESFESTTLVGLIGEKSTLTSTSSETSKLASASLETSTLATSSGTSTLESSATSTLASSRSTLTSISTSETTTTTEMIIESSGPQNNSSFLKEMNLVAQENTTNAQEGAAVGKKYSSIEQIGLNSSEIGNLTQQEKFKLPEGDKINNTSLHNDNSAKDQEDSSCESGEECGDDDVLATGEQLTTTMAPKNDPLVPGEHKKDNDDNSDDDEETIGTNSDSVSCKLKGCYEQNDSNVDESVISSSTHSPKIDETTPLSDTITNISVEYYPTQQPSTTTTSTTLRPKKRRKIICHHWNRHQRQKINKSTALLNDKRLKNHQKSGNANEQAFVLKDLEGKSSEIKMSSIDDDTLSQESLEKVYYQNSEYDDENIPSAYNYQNKLDDNNPGLNENDSLDSKEIKNRLLDLNTPKFFNFEIKRDETVSGYNTQKKREVSSDETQDEDFNDRVFDWNSPKFFNFEIKKDETLINNMHNNMEMSMDSHDVSNTNKNGRPRRHACNKTNASLKKKKSVDEANITSDTDINNRLLDWNAQKFFNFEIKRDEVVSTNYSREKRSVNEDFNITSSATQNDEGTTDSLFLEKRVNSSVISNDSEVVKNNNSSNVGIGKYLVSSGLAKLFNLEVKRNET